MEERASVAPGQGEIIVEEQPFGPAAAVLLATGIGAIVLGFLTTMNEASDAFNSFLAFTDAVGPLSEKTIIAGAAFFVSWAILHGVLRRSTPSVRTTLMATGILLALGFLGTFPIFFEAFASE